MAPDATGPERPRRMSLVLSTAFSMVVGLPVTVLAFMVLGATESGVKDSQQIAGFLVTGLLGGLFLSLPLTVRNRGRRLKTFLMSTCVGFAAIFLLGLILMHG
jgi:hypothetical protein